MSPQFLATLPNPVYSGNGEHHEVCSLIRDPDDVTPDLIILTYFAEDVSSYVTPTVQVVESDYQVFACWDVVAKTTKLPAELKLVIAAYDYDGNVGGDVVPWIIAEAEAR